MCISVPSLNSEGLSILNSNRYRLHKHSVTDILKFAKQYALLPFKGWSIKIGMALDRTGTKSIQQVIHNSYTNVEIFFVTVLTD